MGRLSHTIPPRPTVHGVYQGCEPRPCPRFLLPVTQSRLQQWADHVLLSGPFGDCRAGTVLPVHVQLTNPRNGTTSSLQAIPEGIAFVFGVGLSPCFMHASIRLSNPERLDALCQRQEQMAQKDADVLNEAQATESAGFCNSPGAKTLTAEGVADKLRKPLYTLSAGVT
ncbi:hypothetical protein MGG_17547 [Pyricularia oryzae 70-15]|uniref:Uncharacterized protein n=1 Tax=Pyricularia oryzae (strain 70-15 / ATCC MYA-4617 / FGSC 8958) TaxID=242507 RepID=G4NEV2_PYRO7|nr:uncharacterized protein MGG_17547 [Pyricularia oryzae 70-15]EHA49525.1 hypothetical protein MGG_17547 [Pyricularia oryzae 70-15]